MIRTLIIFVFSLLIAANSHASDDVLLNDVRILISSKLDSKDAKNLAMVCRAFNLAVAKRNTLALSHDFFLEKFDRENVIKFLEKVKGVKRLKIYVLPRKKEGNLTLLTAHFRSLQKLNIRYGEECTTNKHVDASRLGSIDLFVSANPNLKRISVYIPTITDMPDFVNDLANFSKKVPKVMALIDKFDCLGLTEKTLDVLSQTPNLKSLNLNNLETLTSELLEAMAKACPNLERFYLQGAYQISTRSILKLMKDCPGLTIVDQTILTEIDLENVATSDVVCPGMDVLNIIQGTKNQKLAKEVHDLCCGDIMLIPCHCSNLVN